MKYKVSIPEIEVSFEVEEGANLLTQLILHKIFQIMDHFVLGQEIVADVPLLRMGKRYYHAIHMLIVI